MHSSLPNYWIIPLHSKPEFTFIWFQLCVCEAVSRLGLATGRFGTFPGGPLPLVGCCLQWAAGSGIGRPWTFPAPVRRDRIRHCKHPPLRGCAGDSAPPLRVSGCNSPLPPARTQVRFRPEVQKMYYKKISRSSRPFATHLSHLCAPPVGRAPHFEKRCNRVKIERRIKKT